MESIFKGVWRVDLVGGSSGIAVWSLRTALGLGTRCWGDGSAAVVPVAMQRSLDFDIAEVVAQLPQKNSANASGQISVLDVRATTLCQVRWHFVPKVLCERPLATRCELETTKV